MDGHHLLSACNMLGTVVDTPEHNLQFLQLLVGWASSHLLYQVTHLRQSRI